MLILRNFSQYVTYSSRILGERYIELKLRYYIHFYYLESDIDVVIVLHQVNYKYNSQQIILLFKIMKT
jgi:hypothetical protein